jgi:hypothetical protein
MELSYGLQSGALDRSMVTESLCVTTICAADNKMKRTVIPFTMRDGKYVLGDEANWKRETLDGPLISVPTIWERFQNDMNAEDAEPWMVAMRGEDRETVLTAFEIADRLHGSSPYKMVMVGREDAIQESIRMAERVGFFSMSK